MFRLTNFLTSTLKKKETKKLNKAIAIWNFTNRCNLDCLHCYSKSSVNGDDILSTKKAFEVIGELKNSNIGFVIFSGGEPLIRKDIFEIAQKCKENGILTYLSTNGLYINRHNADKIVDMFDYVGISIDGKEDVHDRFRGLKGAFKKSIKAFEILKSKGARVGIRYTLTKETYDSLEFIFNLSENEGIDKIYISHLVYSGGGYDNLKMDISKEQRKEAVEFIINKAFEYNKKEDNKEIVTGNMEVDAILFLKEFSKKYPKLENELKEKLKKWGGNSAGRNLVNIDYKGNIKPDPFFPLKIGNIFTESFEKVWMDKENALLKKLREFPRKLKGKCKDCEYIRICNGGSRPRAWAIYSDLWEEDPSCYKELIK